VERCTMVPPPFYEMVSEGGTPALKEKQHASQWTLVGNWELGGPFGTTSRKKRGVFQKGGCQRENLAIFLIFGAGKGTTWFGVGNKSSKKGGQARGKESKGQKRQAIKLVKHLGDACKLIYMKAATEKGHNTRGFLNSWVGSKPRFPGVFLTLKGNISRIFIIIKPSLS